MSGEILTTDEKDNLQNKSNKISTQQKFLACRRFLLSSAKIQSRRRCLECDKNIIYRFDLSELEWSE